MATDPIVFAMANPDPEIRPEDADGLAAVMATGRSDYPNQINNVLAFPGIFRGALDVGATEITEDMKLAAAERHRRAWSPTTSWPPTTSSRRCSTRASPPRWPRPWPRPPSPTASSACTGRPALTHHCRSTYALTAGASGLERPPPRPRRPVPQPPRRGR